MKSFYFFKSFLFYLMINGLFTYWEPSLMFISVQFKKCPVPSTSMLHRKHSGSRFSVASTLDKNNTAFLKSSQTYMYFGQILPIKIVFLNNHLNVMRNVMDIIC